MSNAKIIACIFGLQLRAKHALHDKPAKKLFCRCPVSLFGWLLPVSFAVLDRVVDTISDKILTVAVCSNPASARTRSAPNNGGGDHADKCRSVAQIFCPF